MSRPGTLTVYRPGFFVVLASFAFAFVCRSLVTPFVGMYSSNGYNEKAITSFLILFTPPLILWVIHWQSTRRKIGQRQADYEKLLLQGYTPLPGDKSLVNFGGITIQSLTNARNPMYSRQIEHKDWSYTDFKVQLYKKARGDIHYADVYYGVMATDLGRILPNVFFDSKQARGRQLRFRFAKEQKHSLEGDFDKFFTTYFPAGYTIDSMSFIAPDVMWALRQAREYDIEIIGNRLYLYGSLWSMPEQLADMEKHILNIKQHLLKNVQTYRDERLPLALGRSHVTPQALSLKPSSFWKIVGIIATVMFILLRILLGALDSGA